MKNILIKTNEEPKSEIIIEKGLKDNLDKFFDPSCAFLITNTTIARLYPKIVKKFDLKRRIIIKDGEKYKNFATFSYIINELLKRKIERKDTVVALGGGVVGDLAGYCASSALRGVKLIQIPTTLLAMADSSIGGKTGINSKYGKNLIGSFYLADKVLIDPGFTQSLNNYEFKCGLGEILKYAFIEKSCKNAEYYNMIDFLALTDKKEIKDKIDTLIEWSAALKVNVVSMDRLEGGLRKILNFGHTFCHPIETIANYKGISHGEAVAYGIRYASKLSYSVGKIDKGYYQKIIELLDKYDLAKKPLSKLKFAPKKMIELMKQDKKVIDGKINLLLATAPAEVGLFDNISLPLLEASLL